MAELAGAQVTPVYRAGERGKLWRVGAMLVPELVAVEFANTSRDFAGIWAPAGMWRQEVQHGSDAKLTKPQLADVMVLTAMIVTELGPLAVESFEYEAKLLATPKAARVRQQLSKWRVRTAKNYREVTDAARVASRTKARVEAIEESFSEFSHYRARDLLRQAQRLGHPCGDPDAQQEFRKETAERWAERWLELLESNSEPVNYSSRELPASRRPAAGGDDASHHPGCSRTLRQRRVFM